MKFFVGSTGKFLYCGIWVYLFIYLLLSAKRENLFQIKSTGFWQTGYAYFTYSNDARANLITYVKNQESHHHKKSFKEELIDMLQEHGVEFDERYLE